MRIIGLGFLVTGFAWLLIDTLFAFTSYQQSRWIWQSQNLPGGDRIPRDVSISAMRDLSLDLKNRHRVILFPGCVMLAGGLLVFGAQMLKVGKGPSEQCVPSEGDKASG